MAKYDPLHRFLRRHRKSDEVVLTFAEIERIIGAILPKAVKDPAWWSNTPLQGRAGVQTRAWLEAGFQASLGKGEVVTFTRTTMQPRLEEASISV